MIQNGSYRLTYSFRDGTYAIIRFRAPEYTTESILQMGEYLTAHPESRLKGKA